MLRSICALLALFFTLAVLSCAEPVSPTLDITQSSELLVAGQSLQLTVKRRFPGGPLDDVTTRVAYTVEKGIANVSDRGLVTVGSEPGSVIVRALDPSSDATALASLVVVAAHVTSIELTPAPAKVLVRGESQAFTATARYNNGSVADVTRDVSWSSTDESVALVGNTSFDKGFVRAVASGNTTILATDGRTLVQGRSIVFVPAESLVLQAILVTPNPAVVGIGKTLQLRADGVYSDGSTKDLTRGVTWTSSRADLAPVDTMGLVGGAMAGDATITASAPDASSTVKGSAAAKVVP